MTSEDRSPHANGRVGAYGLVLTGTLPDASDLVADPPGSWTGWSLRTELAEARPPGDWSDDIGDDHALVALGDGQARVSRRGAETMLVLPAPATPAELAHPYLSATGALAAWWRGDVPVHGGAFVGDGKAWAILGSREAGKSTTVAALWQAGAAILTDDLLVLRGATALAGPRCLDLREPTARRLGIGIRLGVGTTRERWRVPLEQVAPERPLGGFVSLAWGNELSLLPVPMSERAALLVGAFGVHAKPRDPVALLDLLARPFLRLTRPRTLDQLGPAVALLRDRLGT